MSCTGWQSIGPCSRTCGIQSGVRQRVCAEGFPSQECELTTGLPEYQQCHDGQSLCERKGGYHFDCFWGNTFFLEVWGLPFSIWFTISALLSFGSGSMELIDLSGQQRSCVQPSEWSNLVRHKENQELKGTVIPLNSNDFICMSVRFLYFCMTTAQGICQSQYWARRFLQPRSGLDLHLEILQKLGSLYQSNRWSLLRTST